MMTKNGICLNIKESYYHVIRYGLIFYFSSKLYLDKFVQNVDNFVNEESCKLKNKYKLNFNFDTFFAISYYKKIEKRGFYIYDDVAKKELSEDSILIVTLFL